MEQHVLRLCNLDSKKPLTIRALSSIRSLIVNSHTSDSTISSILEALTLSLQLTTDSLLHHHILKLLSDLSTQKPHLSSSILNTITSSSLLSSESTRVTATSLALIASIGDRKLELQNGIDDSLFVSLCFNASVSLRLWLLRNCERLGVRRSVMFAVFLGFTKDPYPYVRKSALDGLVCFGDSEVCEDRSAIEGCYYRAVELLLDDEDCVRCSAVRVVSIWGRILVVTAIKEEEKKDLSCMVFVQLCPMVRDMNVEVRIEALTALGKIDMISDDILMQTLSKKVLGKTKEKYVPREFTSYSSKILLSNSAGAFMHGLEDEFWEVRRAACSSLRKLTIFSTEFAAQALNLLTDMLNDDSLVVRLEVLEALGYMATSDCLNLQEIHMRMLVGTLVDGSELIRHAARKIFRKAKLSKLELFRILIDGLLKNLEIHPVDEADIFSILFHTGRNHGKFAVCVVNEVSQEIEPECDGKLGLDTPRVAAFLLLAISAPLSDNHDGLDIPPQFFSYAVTMLGRLSCALSDVMDQNNLLEYLSWGSKSFTSSRLEVEEDKLSLPVVYNDPNPTGMSDTRSIVPTSSEAGCQLEAIPCKSRGVATSLIEDQPEEEDEIWKAIYLILDTIQGIWMLVQSRCNSEALQALRACKDDLVMFASASPKLEGVLMFTQQYLHIIKLLAKAWWCIMWKGQLYEIGKSEMLLEKLDKGLKEIRCRFVGYSLVEEAHLLELMLMALVLRLSKAEICCYQTTFKKFSATISNLEFLQRQASLEPSDFVIEVKKTVNNLCTSVDASSPLLFRNLLSLFSLKQLSLCKSLRLINVEFDILSNDTESPLPFVPGLPVGIHLKLTLDNVSSENRLWARIRVNDGASQFVFLDLDAHRGCDESKNFTFTLPFYPAKSASLTVWISIGMECLFEGVFSVGGCGGPKHELIYLCKEKEVYLRKVSRE